MHRKCSADHNSSTVDVGKFKWYDISESLSLSYSSPRVVIALSPRGSYSWLWPHGGTRAQNVYQVKS